MSKETKEKILVLLLLVLLLICVASDGFAAPFVVDDPPLAGEPLPTFFKLTGPAWCPATVPAQADGTIKLDIINANIGSNAITVAACGTDEIWGEVCSDAVPFTFTRPSRPATIKAIRLIR